MAVSAEGPSKHCPQCGGARCIRLHRRSAADHLLSWLGRYPYRCESCRTNFRALRAARAATDGKRPPWLLCPRCGADNLQRIPSRKVTPTWSNYGWRQLGIPGYRCPECRMRFFSLRRPRRAPVHPG